MNSILNDNKLMKNLKNIVAEKKLKSEIKITIKKPEIKINKEKIIIPKHFASNSTVIHDIINDDNTLKKIEEEAIKRVFQIKVLGKIK